MTTITGSLIWEIVKRNNAFLVKEFGNINRMVQFSTEPNNLYNVNSFKHSGLANAKTVSIQADGTCSSVVLATTKTNKQKNPSALVHKTGMKKEFSRMTEAITNQVTDNFYMRDLKKAALARLSGVHRSLKVSKFGTKKRLRQTSKKANRNLWL